MALTAGATLALMCIQGAHMQFGPAQTKMAAFVQVCDMPLRCAVCGCCLLRPLCTCMCMRMHATPSW